MLYAPLALIGALAPEGTGKTPPFGQDVIHIPKPPADVLFNLFGALPVTNTILTAWIVMAVLVLCAGLSTRQMKMVPSGFQNLWEMIIEIWLGVLHQTMGARGRRFLPLVCTAFLFILFSNWFGILPIVQFAVTDVEGNRVPLIRSANSDLNLTAAMAVLVIVLAEFWEFRSLGPLGYLKGLFLPNVLRWLEIATRPLSLAFRLFGNVFAGEVLVMTMLGLAPYALFPFLGLEVFVGLIQALIFSMLTLVFLTIATAHEHVPHEKATGGHAAASGQTDHH